MKSVTALVLTLSLGLAVAGQALAYAPATSPRPVKRPGSEIVMQPVMGSVATATAQAPRRSPHPLRRPGSRVVTTAAIDAVVARAVDLSSETSSAVVRSPRPKRRPAGRAGYAATATPTPTPVSEAPAPRQSRRGSVCGVRDIRGQKVDPIPGRLPGCGISDAVLVAEVSGVALSQASVMDCTTAKALNEWVKAGIKPAVGRLGGGLSSLQVAAHYICRTRNNQPGAKISEHGKGQAIDISGFVLKNGVVINVLNGWRDPVQGKVLKAAHTAACGTFGTVLGPNADRYHLDHLHVDTARHRGGAYCR